MKKAVVVVGLAFGDEGKGSCTDFLVRRHNAELVVRFCGGCQAAHNVVTDEGVHHTFSQFGSGTLAGARTFLSRHMLIDPLALVREAEQLKTIGVTAPLSLLALDPACVVVTPYHRLANRIREAARGAGRHGSCGRGVGEACADALAGYAFHAYDCHNIPVLHELYDRKIEEMRPLREAAPALFQEMERTNPAELRASYCWLLSQLNVVPWSKIAKMEPETVIFEGAQGMLLDAVHGFAPYHSWTDCTFDHANALIAQAGGAEVTRIGVLRSYFTRHGPGPFPTEDAAWRMPEPHNRLHPFMGPFRTGPFDAVLAKYAAERSGGLDALAITHLDSPWRVICEKYAPLWDGKFTASSLSAVVPAYRVFHTYAQFLARIEELLGVPVCLESTGPRPSDKRWIEKKGVRNV